MATLTQGDVRPQLDVDGPAYPSQVYVPAQSGLALPRATGYLADSTHAGHALAEQAMALVSLADAQQLNLAVSGTSPATLTIPAPGAGMVALLVAVLVGINPPASGTTLVNVTFPGNLLSGLILRCLATTTSAGQLIWTPPAAWPQTAANQSSAITVTWTPNSPGGSPTVNVLYLVRPAA